MSFKEFYSTYSTKDVDDRKHTDEDMFMDAVGVKIPSLSAFIAWLILNKKIKPYIIDVKYNRPVSLFNIPCNKKILHLVNSLKKIKELSTEFSKKWN
jgi:hypothetical protein